ncbi:DoxX family protein [Nocardioides cynanchi]|uniref:DoxX family protein n=1 Tax=Nocardioides cynanchi TaxID=2558918 RepID=UPI001246898C|nr:DoxX family protein [Nocardioides cynanchi]
MKLPRDVAALVGIFAVSGVVHLVRPQVYEPLMPSWVPRHREVILGSGVAELACAAGLAVPASRRTAGWASAALLLGVFPGNVKMALDAQRSRRPGRRTTALKIGTLLRLPLQWPMIRAALRAARN